MDFSVVILLYLLIGAGVATALFVRTGSVSRTERLFETATGVVFWPVYVPVLLRDASGLRVSSDVLEEPRAAHDEMAAVIAQVDGELDVALNGLDGWSERVLSSEHDRITELRAAWKTQAQRIRELDALLAKTRSNDDPFADCSVEAGERFQKSAEARDENIERLAQLRSRMYRDLMGTLAWVRELVTMIHLARFTGAPASRTEDLVSQIAAAVEGLSEVAEWGEATGKKRDDGYPAGNKELPVKAAVP